MSIIGSKTVLCLQIKEQCLNEIISGKKTSEYRKILSQFPLAGAFLFEYEQKNADTQRV